MDAGQILAEATDLLFKNSTLNGHPRFFGYITSSASPIGARTFRSRIAYPARFKNAAAASSPRAPTEPRRTSFSVRLPMARATEP